VGASDFTEEVDAAPHQRALLHADNETHISWRLQPERVLLPLPLVADSIQFLLRVNIHSSFAGRKVQVSATTVDNSTLTSGTTL
jgi:hypothetical protein